MDYEKALRQAERTGRLQEDCEFIADYMIRYDLSVKQAERDLINEGVLLNQNQ